MPVRIRRQTRWLAISIRWDELSPTGQRVQRSKVLEDLQLPLDAGPRAIAKARQEAQKRLDELTAPGRSPAGGRALLRDYLPAWLELHGAPLSGNTVRSYRQAIDHHIAPALGSIRLDQLTALDLERYFATKREAGCADRSLNTHRAVLTAALDRAVRWGLIASSPMTRVTRARRQTALLAEHAVWDPAQLRTFLGHVADDPDVALWRLLALGGLRIGEALALSWSCVDWSRGEVVVRRTLSRDADERPVIREGTKTHRPRTVGLDAGTMAALRAHQTRQRETRLASGKRPSGELVFPGGTAIGTRSPDGVRSRFAGLCDRAGVPDIGLHGLRHSHASHLLASGVSVKVVSDRLGHARATMTLEVYAHLTVAMRAGAVEAIEAVLVAGAGEASAAS